MRRSCQRVGLAAAIALLLAGVITAPGANATNFGSYAPPTSGCSNWSNPCSSTSLSTTNHWWMPVSLDVDILASVRWAAANDYNPTDMAWTEVSGVNSANNVYYYDNDWGDNGAIGWAICPNYAARYFSHPNQICVGSEVHFNLYATYVATWHNPDGSVNWSDLGFITAHESGHSVGLRHTTDTTDLMCGSGFYNCSRTPWISNHDGAHLNATY